MSFQQSNIARLRAKPEASFGVDATDSGLVDIPFVEGSLQLSLDQEMAEPNFAVQHIDQRVKRIKGVRSGTISFQIGILGSGGTPDAGETVNENAVHVLLAGLLGGEETPTSRAIDTADATTVTLTGGVDFEEGGAFGVSIAGKVHMREIGDISGQVLTPKLALPSGPEGVCIGARSYWPGIDPDTSMQFVCEGLIESDRFVLLGCNLDSLAFEQIGPAEQPVLNMSIRFADWKYASDAEGDFSGALATATYSNVLPFIVVDSDPRMQVVDSATLSGTELHVSQIGFTPNLEWTDQRSPAGVQTILRRVRTRGDAPELTFTVPWSDTWFTRRDSYTDVALAYQMGSGAGASVLLTAPACQVTNVQGSDSDGIRTMDVTCVARADESISTAADDNIERAPFRLHML